MLDPDRVDGAKSLRDELQENVAPGSQARPSARVPTGARGVERDRRRRRRGAASELPEAVAQLAQSLGTLRYDYVGPTLPSHPRRRRRATGRLHEQPVRRHALALTDDFTDWSALDAVHRLWIVQNVLCGLDIKELPSWNR